MKVGISIDWDYFMRLCPELSGYTHYHLHEQWREKPPCNTWAISCFKNAFQVKERSLACESHVLAYYWFKDCDLVLNFDYHVDNYDNYFHPDLVDCRSWIAPLMEDYGVEVVTCTPGSSCIPILEDNFASKVEEFHKVLACRSSPWTHPDYDHGFEIFTEDYTYREERAIVPRDLKNPPARKAPAVSVADEQHYRNSHVVVKLESGESLII